jgi:hypothetical protein
MNGAERDDLSATKGLPVPKDMAARIDPGHRRSAGFASPLLD